MIRQSRVAAAALLVGLVWAAGACSDGLTDINDNPNAPTGVPVEFLLPTAIQGAVGNAFGSGQTLSHTNIWPQHTVEIQYPDEERGIVRPSTMDTYWSNYYTGSLKDIQTVIDIGVETDHVNAQAVGLIWKSWIFHLVTDYWGDVPYSQALKGETEGGATPVYDAQADIYDGMLADLTTAVGLLNPNAQTFGAGDLIYGSDMGAWKKFANSLRMRLAMRLSEADAATAKTQFVAAFNAGGFTSNADNAFLNYPGPPYSFPLYDNYLGRDDYGVSSTMIDTLKALSDPRLFLYAEPAASDGVYRGHGNGRQSLPAGQSLGDISRIGNFWRANGKTTPATIMTYSEVLFLQAEAAAKGWISGSPGALYMAAIEAHMNQYDAYGVGPTDAQISAYLAQPKVAYAGLNSIHLQKWISLYMAGPEAWANVRRTGVPQLAMGPDLTIVRIP
ncbi:MAG: SusD/RagB family nutrient-binding outer membrane lipoprotein, partial [Longimicrobiales bacterium]|nr:SusD/RagB family nutrient-binding outer membrane lipoprotein [Longimicrobiales bacterium]